MKFIVSACFLFLAYSFFAQTTFPWSGTYSGTGVSRTYSTTVSGVTMSATITNSENVWQDASPKWFPSGSTVSGGGCSGIPAVNQGMLLSTDWTSNTTKTITVVINFSTPVNGPVSFKLYDINDDGFGSWADRIIISGTNSVGGAVNVSNSGTACVSTGGSVSGSGTATLTYNSGSSSACTCWGNNTVNVGAAADCISSITILYKSGVSPANNNNPKQYVVISDLTATVPTSVTAPSAITGTTSICQGGSTTLTATGGNATSQWFTGSCGGTAAGTGASITVSPATATTYYVRNAGTSCTPASACVSVNVDIKPSPAMTSSNTASVCSGGTLNIPLTSDFGTSYSWIAANNTNVTGESTSAQNSSTINNTLVNTTGSAQNVTYTVTPTGNGCSGTPQAVTVTVNPAPAMTSSATASVCSGGTLNIPLTANPTSTFSWIAADNSNVTGESLIAQTSSTINNTLTNTTATPQTVIYSVTPTSGTCSGSSQIVTVTVNPAPAAPTITPNGPTTFCPGGNVVLTSSSATGNVWSTTETTQSITVTASGTYTLSFTDGNGCPSSAASIVITQSAGALPTAAIAGGGSYCAGAASPSVTAAVTGTSPWTVSYTLNGVAQTPVSGATSPITLGNTAGTYVLTNVSDAGCSNTASGTATITENPAPSMTSSSTASVCSGGTLNIPLTANPASTFSWIAADNSNVTGESLIAQTSGTINNTLTNNTTTPQTVTYSVTPTAGTCSGSSQIVTVTVNPAPAAPTITPNGPTTFCPGGNVVLTSSSATGNVWSTTETTQSITVTASGTYTLSFTDGNGCPSSAASIVITQSAGALPTATISGGGSYCAGMASTPVTAAVTGTSPWTVTYTLNGVAQTPVSGATSPITLGNAAGTYVLTNVSDAGCSNAASGTATITENPAPSMTSSSTASVCSGGTLNIPLTANPASTFSWIAADNSNVTGESLIAQTSSTINNTLTNNTTIAQTVIYSVTPTAGTCSGSSQIVTVTVNPIPGAPTITPNGPTTFCPGGNVVLTSSSATGNVWSTTETTPSITVTASGTYTLSFTDGNGCPSSAASIVITQSAGALPTAAIAGGGSYCAGAASPSVTATVTGTSPWTVSYTLNGVAQTPVSGATSPITLGNTAGTYVLTNVSDAGCSNTASGTATITENPAPSMTSSSTASVCSGGTLNIPLTANPASTFSWIAADNSNVTGESLVAQTSGTINNTLTNNTTTPQTITYSVTPTAGTCSGTAQTVTVTVNPIPGAPTITPNGPTTFCPGGNVVLTSSSATGNVWSTTETTPSITVTASGTYTLSFTDGNGCPSSAASIVITQSAGALPTAAIAGGGSYCAGAASTPVTAAVTGTSPWTVSYTLNGVAQTPVSGATSPITLGNTAGTYVLTNVSDAGCSNAASGTATITENPLPTVTVNNLSVCAGVSGTITATPSVSGGTYLWSPNGETSSSIVVNPSATTTYSVVYTVGTCASSSAVSNVTVTPNPTVTVNNASICQGQTAVLTATPSVPGGTYLWTPNGETTASISVSPSVTANYSVVYSVNGCTSASTAATVTVNVGPTVSFTADTLIGCAPFTVNFTGVSNGDPGACVWTLSNGITLNGCNPAYTFTQPGCYEVALTSTLNGCSSTSQSAVDYICVEANPVAFFTATPPVLSESNPTVILDNLSSGAATYQWNFGDGSSSNQFEPNHTYNNGSASYSITLNAYSALGCPSSYSVNITYEDDFVFFVPNAFTPDGDKDNNVFMPVFTPGYDPYSYNLLIFDRWGEIIFESNDTEYGWDGTYIMTSGIVQDGIYVWKISFKMRNNDERRTYTGHVTLIR